MVSCIVLSGLKNDSDGVLVVSCFFIAFHSALIQCFSAMQTRPLKHAKVDQCSLALPAAWQLGPILRPGRFGPWES